MQVPQSDGRAVAQATRARHRLLLVEDTDADAEILFHELRKGGFDCMTERVQTLPDLQRALSQFVPDIILADYSLPGFDGETGMKALELAREQLPDVPFIFVSGNIGEERAIDALRRGATDYVLKNNRARLLPAIERALTEAHARRDSARVESARRDSVHRFELFMEHLPGVAFMKDLDQRYTYVNGSFARAIGRPASDVIGRTASEVLPNHMAREAAARHGAALATGQSQSALVDLDGFDGSNGGSSLLLHSFPITDETERPVLVGCIGVDVTAQRRAEEALALSEERLRSVAEASREWMWEMDRHGICTWCGPTAAAVTGYPAESLIGRRLTDLLVPDARSGARHELQRVIDERRGWDNFAFGVVQPGGGLRWIEGNAFPLLDAKGAVRGIRGAARDVTERVEQQQRIARLARMHALLSEISSMIVRVTERAELYAAVCRIAVEHGNFVMAWIGVAEAGGPVVPVAHHGADSRYVANAARLIDVAAIEKCSLGAALRGRTPIVINDIASDERMVLRAQALGRGYRAAIVLPLVRDDASFGVVALYAAEAGFFTADEIALLETLSADVSFALDHIAKAERLAYVSRFDTLTGLANRSRLLETLGQRITAPATNGQPVAVLMIDIDRFRFINDSLGRSAGDQLLVELGRRLVENFSAAIGPARTSGGRFKLVLESPDETSLALEIESGYRRTFTPPFVLDGVPLHVTAKIGIVLYPQDADSVERLLVNAEAALMRAKDGSDNVVFYQADLNARVAHQLHLEGRMRRAVQEQQFVLHYQPKFDLQTRRIVGAEALIRWLDPERGLIPPLDFIPLLEETGLIVEVGRWVVEQACADRAAWRAEGLAVPRIAVNVSQAQVRQKDFVATVLAALATSPGSDGSIDIEITESMVMADGAAHVDKLRELRAAGLHIHMDDFGTGHSSLAQIARLPLHTLKIDRAFIASMAEGNDQAAIVSMIIRLAAALGLCTVAEGVETAEQAATLQALGCDEGQGWYFSRPLTAAALRALLLATSADGPEPLGAVAAAPATAFAARGSGSASQSSSTGGDRCASDGGLAAAG